MTGEDIVFMATDIELLGNVDWVMLQSCFDCHFLLVLEKQESHDGVQTFFAVVQLIGTSKQADNFIYRSLSVCHYYSLSICAFSETLLNFTWLELRVALHGNSSQLWSVSCHIRHTPHPTSHLWTCLVLPRPGWVDLIVSFWANGKNVANWPFNCLLVVHNVSLTLQAFLFRQFYENISTWLSGLSAFHFIVLFFLVFSYSLQFLPWIVMCSWNSFCTTPQ